LLLKVVQETDIGPKIKFDARRAKLLQPQEHIAFDDFPGLRLEATTTRRTWTYRYRSPLDGNMRQIKLGNWPAMPLAAAVVEWETKRNIRDSGQDPAHTRRRARARVAGLDAELVSGAYTVRRLVADYLAGHVEHNASPAAQANTRYALGTPIEPILDMLPETVTRKMAFDLLERLRDRPTYANRIKMELGAAWDYALDAGRLPANTPNWWRQIMRGRLRSKGRSRNGERVTDKSVLTGPEIAVLVPWVQLLEPDVADVTQLYLWTGQRGNEIVAMQGVELSVEADGLWWTIPKAKTKNKRIERATAHRVPLVGRAEVIIRRRWASYGNSWLFPYTAPKAGRRAAKSRECITQASVGQTIARCQPYWKGKNKLMSDRPIPVTAWTPHDLRRTARTMLGAMGCANEVAEEIIGHIKPGIVGVYNLYSYDAEKREWLMKLAAHLEELAVS
jgi:integrase